MTQIGVAGDFGRIRLLLHRAGDLGVNQDRLLEVCQTFQLLQPVGADARAREFQRCEVRESFQVS